MKIEVRRQKRSRARLDTLKRRKLNPKPQKSRNGRCKVSWVKGKVVFRCGARWRRNFSHGVRGKALRSYVVEHHVDCPKGKKIRGGVGKKQRPSI